MLVDFHVHTMASEDSLAAPAQLIDAARRRGLDRIVITDHNTIAGALTAQALDPGLVIVGEEIMTTRGEILAAFVTQEIPPGLSPQETIRRLREQGAFVSVSHPFDRMRSGGWELSDLLEIAPLVDALEIFNARCIWPEFNRQAQAFAQQHHLSGTAGSDAHALSEVGRASLVVGEFSNADDLRVVIKGAKVWGRLSPFWVHFFSTYARFRKKSGR